MDEKKKTDAYLKVHPYTGNPNEPVNAQIGMQGNPVLPGQSAGMQQTLGKGKRFRGFPKIKGKTNPTYDLDRIRSEYMESPITDWTAYCGARGYNPRLYSIPFQRWVREKKYRQAWLGVRDDLEAEGMALGPRVLLRQVKAVRQIPETLNAMMSLIQHALFIHQQEAKIDQAVWRKHLDAGKIPDSKELRFSASPMDVAALSSALKQTGEMLYRSLGIDSSVGVNAQKWLQLVETEIGQMEGGENPKDNESLVNVQVMGASDFREAIKDAMDRYMDRPGTTEALEAGVGEIPADLAASLSDEERQEVEETSGDDG